MLEDNNLLEGGVGGEGPGSEVGSDPTADILVLLAHRVNEIMLAEELLAKRVAHQVKGIGADIGEDLMGKISAANEDDELADDVVGGDT